METTFLNGNNLFFRQDSLQSIVAARCNSAPLACEGPRPSRGFGRSLAFAELLQGRLFGVRLLWTELRRSSLCAEGGSMMMLTACQPRPVVASAAQTTKEDANSSANDGV